MLSTKPSWTAGCVLVCGNDRGPDAPKPSCGRQGGAELRDWLKDRIRERGLKGRVLSSRTSCLGVCSAKGVTVDIVPGPGGERRMLVLDATSEREALWTQVEACLLGGSAEAPSVGES